MISQYSDKQPTKKTKKKKKKKRSKAFKVSKGRVSFKRIFIFYFLKGNILWTPSLRFEQTSKMLVCFALTFYVFD